MPRRPPKRWFNKLKRELSGKSSEPERLAGWIWHHHLTPAQRRRATRQSEHSFASLIQAALDALAEGRIPEPTAKVTILGDLKCPRCEAVIVTPVGDGGRLQYVRPGRMDCPGCGKTFDVGPDEASLANRRLGVIEGDGVDVAALVDGLLEEDES